MRRSPRGSRAAIRTGAAAEEVPDRSMPDWIVRLSTPVLVGVPVGGGWGRVQQCAGRGVQPPSARHNLVQIEGRGRIEGDQLLLTAPVDRPAALTGRRSRGRVERERGLVVRIGVLHDGQEPDVRREDTVRRIRPGESPTGSCRRSTGTRGCRRPRSTQPSCRRLRRWCCTPGLRRTRYWRDGWGSKCGEVTTPNGSELSTVAAVAVERRTRNR